MQRYFIEEHMINLDNLKVNIDGSDFHHIKNVMRMNKGDKVYVSTKLGKTYICELLDFFYDYVEFKIIEEIDKKVELDIEVVIAFGLVRREKTEEVLRRITELGASGFVSVQMKRSIVKIKDKDTKNNKLNRMNLIVKEAAEQSHRNKLLTVYDTINFKEFIKFSKDFDLCLYAYEESGRSNNFNFKKFLKEFTGKKILVLVGPEGGIDLEEVELLNKNNFHPIGLGPRILRAETAPLYVMAAISYELEIE